MRFSALGFGVELLVAATHDVAGQRIKMASVLSDSAARGVFWGAISRFRGLAGVDVVILSRLAW